MIARRTLLLLPLLVLGCNREEALEGFPPLRYGYLTPIRLNVASIEVDDRSPPASASNLEALDPVRLVDALKQMAADRLTADGSAGRAVFVIDQARLSRNGGQIDGMIEVHLDVFAGQGGQRVGYAEVKVVRQQSSPGDGDNLRAVLYKFTKHMMDDVNVEFEYQVRRSLRDWVQATVDTAPLPPPVEAQPLSGEARLNALSPTSSEPNSDVETQATGRGQFGY